MPIDPDKALGQVIPGGVCEYAEKDVILYHLGIGAGNPPTDERELDYVYEGRLKVLPTFGVIPALRSMSGILDVPGLDFDPTKLLHGEHAIEVLGPLPVAGVLTSTGRIAHIWDKGHAAVVVVEITSTDAAGVVVCVNHLTMFLRGEGGFGGDPGPGGGTAVPERAPDVTAEITTLPQQALLYRLSGDWLPLHADPEIARGAGFEAPILHGLCSYGAICRAVVDRFLDGDVGAVRRFSGRFAGVVYPGDTITVSMWADGDDVVVTADNATRGTPVLRNAALLASRAPAGGRGRAGV